MGGITPNKKKKSLLGSVEITDLQQEVQQTAPQVSVETPQSSHVQEPEVTQAPAPVNEPQQPAENVQQQPAATLVGQDVQPVVQPVVPGYPGMTPDQTAVQPGVQMPAGQGQMPGQFPPGYQFQPQMQYPMQGGYYIPQQQYPGMGGAMPNPYMYQMIQQPKGKARGRKRTQLIPDDVDKGVYIELPSKLIAVIQQQALASGMSMKELIGRILLEKFMK